jgi:hypothetical protein
MLHTKQVPWELVQEVLHVLSALNALNTYLEFSIESGMRGEQRMGKTKFDRRFMVLVLDDLMSFCQPVLSEADRSAGRSAVLRQTALLSRRRRRQQLIRDLGVISLLFKLTCNVHDKLIGSADMSSAASHLVTGPVAVAGAAFGAPNPAIFSVAASAESLNLETTETLKLFKLAHRVLQCVMVGNDENRLCIAGYTTEILCQITAEQYPFSGLTSIREVFDVAVDTIMEVFNTHQRILEKVHLILPCLCARSSLNLRVIDRCR